MSMLEHTALADFRPGGPEHLFGVLDVSRRDDGALTASMEVPSWLLNDGLHGEAAGLGVLIDDVLGYVVNEESDCWSVSTELSVDLCAPVRVTAGAVLSCVGRAVHVDERGAVVDGEVRDGSGQLVARCTLRGRFTDRQPVGGSGHQEAEAGVSRLDLRSALSPEVDLSAHPVTATISNRFTNPTGNLHGGMAFCLAESAAAAIETRLGRTASVRLQLVRGTPEGSRLTLHARTVYAGRTFAVIAVEARDTEGRLALTATVTREA